jgi:hypothetical protein
MAVRLFEIDKENNEVMLDKEFIHIVPEFKNILVKDKGSPGDNDGRKKLMAKKKFFYIYLMEDYNSILENYEPYEKRIQAMEMLQLTEKDIDADVLAALDKYRELQSNATKSLKLLRAVKVSITQLEEYYEKIDFTDVDKKGELLHNPNSFLQGLQRLPDVLEAMAKLEYLVRKELQDGEGVRGNTVKGLNEDPA